ncbi:MAG: hypothetical protein JWM05_530 [Acidimicrobiales bacterium]|nr:hypothetical protein [Acidimicrobiales bacterium]
MFRTSKPRIVALLMASALVFGIVASPRAEADGSLLPFAYKVDATTHLKKLNQTVTIPTGTLIGNIDLSAGTLTGALKLPPATVKLKLAGIVPLVTARIQAVPTKPVRGVVDISTYPFAVTATATFNIRILSAKAGILPVNLVGLQCTTSSPVSVTMRGTAGLGEPATFTGTYTIPPLKTCGPSTPALNLVIPGPGNTFTAHATPA